MATRFAVFRGAVSDSEDLIERANGALAEIEAAGGEYVDSHWSTAGPSSGGGISATLVVVYEESGASKAQADRTAKARSF